MLKLSLPEILSQTNKMIAAIIRIEKKIIRLFFLVIVDYIVE